MSENIDMVALAHEAAGIEPEAPFWATLKGLPTMQKAFGLLTLDTKRTERAAKAGIVEDAPIVISKEPRVQIATDLSGYLAEVKP